MMVGEPMSDAGMDGRARIYSPDYWAGRASRDGEFAAALKALAESRARYGDMDARVREKQAEAWGEGYMHGYVVGAEEGATGTVVEYTAPNPYRAV